MDSSEYRFLKFPAGRNRPQTVRVLYAMRNGFLYRSTDGGINWKLGSDSSMEAMVAEGTTLVTGARPLCHRPLYQPAP